MNSIYLILVIAFVLNGNVYGLGGRDTIDNGLAHRPPMGWLAWLRYTCTIDCNKYPNDCINEQLFKRQAEKLLTLGFTEYGYQYVNIDDCWSEWDRDPVTKKLVPDRKRFPGGIRALADFIHSKGLKLGIYGDAGTKTCEGYPGQKGQNGTDYWQLDADTFAEWGADSLKLDGCWNSRENYEKDYLAMGDALNKTGRPILYSCSYPAYMHLSYKQFPNYEVVQKHCNLYRNYYDIGYSWTGILRIMDFYALNQDRFKMYSGPGAWMDPDMLVIGPYGLSYDQMRAQMAIWAIWSSPLYMSTDLNSLDQETIKILQNRHVIDVNQDPLGSFGLRVENTTRDDDGRGTNFEVWVKPMTPIVGNGIYSYAVVFHNRYILGPPTVFSRQIKQILTYKGLDGAQAVESNAHRIGWDAYDLFDNNRRIFTDLSTYSNISLKVNPAGGVRMIKLVPKVYQVQVTRWILSGRVPDAGDSQSQMKVAERWPFKKLTVEDNP